jgi:GDPmannose 4,6-dehydratase
MVCGVCGQDGSYLARFLLAKGYAVVGTSRNRRTASLANLTRLGIHDRIELRTLDPGNVEGVDRILAEEQPDEVYNLTGPSSVRLSFERPVETVKSISRGSLGLLEAIRRTRPSVRYYNAGSSERFGSIADGAATEATALRPCSPYGVGKVAAYWQVSMYRLTHGLSACTGFLFNHESPLRPESYVTRRVVAAACRIASGSRERLRLGELGVQRDWGWAPDYVEAMWLMLQQERPEDLARAARRGGVRRGGPKVARARGHRPGAVSPQGADGEPRRSSTGTAETRLVRHPRDARRRAPDGRSREDAECRGSFREGLRWPGGSR